MGSPFSVKIVPVVDVDKSTCSGPGLEEAQEDTETHFTVSLKSKLGEMLPLQDLKVTVLNEEKEELSNG